MPVITTKHTVIAMKPLIAAARKPRITSIALPGRRFADKIRFAPGSAITLLGAGVLLSDLIALIPLFG